MLDAEMAGSLVQFGTAGLIGWMWLSERRDAATAVKQLREAHERIVQEKTSLDAVLGAVRENTRVLEQIAESQRALRDTMVAMGVERVRMRESREERKAGETPQTERAGTRTFPELTRRDAWTA
jgi:hypothetical protein